MGGDVALLCMLHPASLEKQTRCLDLLKKSAREYYIKPSADCTTWSYFTPMPQPKDPDTEHLIGGLEIYKSKQALQAQIEDPIYFQPYHQTVKQECLYARGEELVTWYQTAGFIARNVAAPPYGGKVTISVSKLACLDQPAVVQALRHFAGWVRGSESYVLTYAIFTRPKARDEVLIFVRYKDTNALKMHDQAPEHQNFMRLMGPYLDTTRTSTTIWREVENSFVSNVVGGGKGTDSKAAKL